MVVSVLRKEARNNLKGKWKKAILMMITFFITTFILSFINSWISTNTPYGLFANILNIIITICLNYGLMSSFIKLKREEEVNVLHFIYYAGRDAEKVWKVIGKLLLKTLGYIILLVFFIYLTITEFISLYYGYGMRLSYFVEVIGVIILSVLLSMKMLYYSLNNYVLFDNKDDKAKNILKESERLMKNHRWDFVKLNLSFAGWFILGTIFSVGIILALYFFAKINNYALLYISYIPLILLLPYLYVATTCFYDNLLYNNPKPKDEELNNKKNKKKLKNKKK